MARRARFKPWCPPGRPGSSPGWSTMNKVTVTVDVDGIPAEMSVESWMKFYEQTGILFTSSKQKYDPYKVKNPRKMTDKYSRTLEPGQLIMTQHFAVGLIVSMTSGGNPRCISYNLKEEKLSRYAHHPHDWRIRGPSKTKKIGDITTPTAWTEYRCIVLREAGNPKTELPSTIKIVKEFTKNPMFDI